MNSFNNNIFEIIGAMDQAPKIAALRALTNGACSRTIRLIREALRDDPQAQPRDEVLEMTSLDQRNANDLEARGDEVAQTIRDTWGFDSPLPPMDQAVIMHGVYSYALAELNTVSTNRYDQPMTPAAMINFMAKAQTRGLDDSLLEAVSKYIGVDRVTIEKMNEIRAQRAQEAFEEVAPAILARFEDIGDNPYEGAFEDLTPLQQTQLAFKTCDGLRKAENQVINRALASNQLTVLGDIPLIRKAYADLYEWYRQLEQKHTDVLSEAIESGLRPMTHDMLQVPKQ